jgi:predicted PurR-regulated permease PerM
VLTCLYVARNIVLPVVLAMVLKLLFQPLVKLLERIRIPKIGGALVSLLLLLGVFVGLGALLSSPASRWAEQLPQAWPMLQQRFAVLQKPIAHLEHVLDSMGVHLDGGDSFLSHPVSMVTDVFSGTGTVASNLLETLLVLFYLLVFGETFLRRLVEVLPRFDDKREAVEISMHMERDLSAYLLTITVINAVVGCATALVMWACGVPGPILWGVVAFCLNFVPILGPFFGILMFLAVGIVTDGFAWIAILPACLYFGIHVAEGEIITPMLLASRFTINPVAVMLSLIFWYWMWGVAGAILAVPMLAIVKIIFDRLRPFRAFGHLLEG